MHLSTNRWWRTLAVWCLVFIQAQLLWVAEFHNHEGGQIALAAPPVIRSAAISTQGAAVRPPCVACQIGQQNVAHPARGFPLEPHDLVIPFRAASVLPDTGMSPLTVIPARAPPAC
jgi:hypothetical protein